MNAGLGDIPTDHLRLLPVTAVVDAGAQGEGPLVSARPIKPGPEIPKAWEFSQARCLTATPGMALVRCVKEQILHVLSL